MAEDKDKDIEKQIEDILIDKEHEQVLKELKDFPAMSEEEYIDMILEEPESDKRCRESIRAMNRARYAIYLSMYILEAIGDILGLKDNAIQEIKLEALESAGKRMETGYKIKIDRI